MELGKGTKEFPRLTIDISGFGGSYEMGCQLMLESGMQFLKEHPDFSFEGYGNYTGITGIMKVPEGEIHKQFDDALLSHPIVKEYGATGAMHQAVVNHLFWIHKKGYSFWIGEFPEERKFLFDGTEESCPPQDVPAKKQ